MPQSFLNLSPSTWNLLFLVVRYVMVALLLAYLTKVFVKRKDVVTDIKGAVLEWQVETYKEIHRWLMGLQRVTAPPSQQEQWFRSLLSSRRFKIGYQGMAFVSFFDTPEKLIQFVTEFHQMLNKEEGFIDETLKQKLISFQIWLDDVIEYLGAKEIFSHFDVDTFHFEYPRAFADEASFDAFYERLIDVNRDHQIYLDDKVSRQLDKSLHLYTLLKLWLDAFCDTERAVDLKVPQERAKRHIDWMYKLTGMMMFSHCTRVYGVLDKVVCRQMNHFSLTYKRHIVRKWLQKVCDRFLFWVDTGAREGGLKGKVCQDLLWRILDKHDRNLSHIMEVAVQIMRYVHFSDDYQPQEFFGLQRLPNEHDQELWGKVFEGQLHGA